MEDDSESQEVASESQEVASESQEVASESQEVASEPQAVKVPAQATPVIPRVDVSPALKSPSARYCLTKPPKPFKNDADPTINDWEKWLNAFNRFLRDSRQGLDDEEKISAFLDAFGPKGKELLGTLKANPPCRKSTGEPIQTQPGADSDQIASSVDTKTYNWMKYDDMTMAFSAFFASKSSDNLVYERFKFNTYNWLFGQPLREYIRVLRRAAARCNFLETDDMIRDRLLLQVRDITLLECLLKIKDLTLEKAVEMCLEHEDSDYRHNPAAQRPPPESESAAKRRRKRKRKTDSVGCSDAIAVPVTSNGEAPTPSGVESNHNKFQDTTKLRPSKKKRHRWAKALQNVKAAVQG